jgi:hypothetical protein
LYIRAARDFSWSNQPKQENVYQKCHKNTKWPHNVPKGSETCQNFPSQVLKKGIKIGILGKQINHLATLLYKCEAEFSKYFIFQFDAKNTFQLF